MLSLLVQRHIIKVATIVEIFFYLHISNPYQQVAGVFKIARGGQRHIFGKL